MEKGLGVGRGLLPLQPPASRSHPRPAEERGSLSRFRYTSLVASVRTFEIVLFILVDLVFAVYYSMAVRLYYDEYYDL